MGDLAHTLGLPAPLRDHRDFRAPHYVSALYMYLTESGTATGAYAHAVFDIRTLPDTLLEKVEDLQTQSR